MTENVDGKKHRGFLRPLFYVGLLAGALYFGDKTQPYTAMKENSYFHNASVEDGFYQSPRTLDIGFVKNNKNRVEVYLFDKMTGDSLKIRENMHVGTIGNTIDDKFDGFKNDFNSWWSRTSDKASDILYDVKKRF